MTLWQLVIAKWNADVAFLIWFGEHWYIPLAIAVVIVVLRWRSL